MYDLKAWYILQKMIVKVLSLKSDKQQRKIHKSTIQYFVYESVKFYSLVIVPYDLLFNIRYTVMVMKENK